MKRIVIAGIGTGVGKTFIAAILTEAWEADYWKPIQSGNLTATDTDFVKEHVSNEKSFFHPEAYRLTEPMSPHVAAKIDELEIDSRKLSVPATTRPLLIELAGGLMVPLNDRELNIDLLIQWNAPVILVSQNYLGSINHTLLSVEILKSRKIKLMGIIFNGLRSRSTEDFILKYTGISCLAKVDQAAQVNKEIIRQYAATLKAELKNLF